MNLPNDQGQTDSLVERLKSERDPTVLATLFDLHRGRLKTLVSLRMDRRLHGRVDPSDVLQEAYLDLAKRVDRFCQREDMSFYVWLRLVVAERLQKFHRTHLGAEMRDVRREVPIRQHGSRNATSLSLAAALLGEYSSVVQKAIRHETQIALQQKMDELEPLDREIILLRLFEGLTNQESAEVLELTKFAASKRYVRAMKRLRTLLAEVPGFGEFVRNSTHTT